VIERILVPTDTSDFEGLALQYALIFQKTLGAKLTLLYAQEFSLLLTGEHPIGYYLENVPEAKTKAVDELRKYAREHVPGDAPVTTTVVDDTPARAIVATAERIDADLIIMGTHGRTGLRRAFLGSVAERVLRETKRPVLTVRPPLLTADREVNFRTILCPVNFTAVAHEALDHACELARDFGASLVVMHVSELDETSDESIQTRFHDWVDPRVRERTRYQRIIASGDPAARILELADNTGVDLIVIGAQHKRFSDRTVIGATTDRITRFARQPVLTILRHPAVEPAREHEAEPIAV